MSPLFTYKCSYPSGTGVIRRGDPLMAPLRRIVALLVLGMIVAFLTPTVFAHGGAENPPPTTSWVPWEHDLNNQ